MRRFTRKHERKASYFLRSNVLNVKNNVSSHAKRTEATFTVQTGATDSQNIASKMLFPHFWIKYVPVLAKVGRKDSVVFPKPFVNYHFEKLPHNYNQQDSVFTTAMIFF